MDAISDPAKRREMEPSAAERGLRRGVLLVVVLGLCGATADLLLIEHYEDGWQSIPLALLLLAAICLLWLAAARSVYSVWALRVAMLLLVAGAVTGLTLHFRGSAEFHRDLNPELSPVALTWAVLRSKSPPALAPAMLLQIGLLGLAYTYRHPALRTAAVTNSKGDEQ